MTAPAAPLALALGREGLVQFGQFVQSDGAVWPVATRLVWLPSYPAMLRDAAEALVQPLRHSGVERLLSTAETVALGTALSLSTEVPLAFFHGAVRDYTAAYVIEGAYDVGHPTALLTDVLVDAAQAESIADLARRVGLEIGAVLALLDLGRGARAALEDRGLAVVCALTLCEMLPVLEDAGLLPPLMRRTVEDWIASPRGAKPGVPAR